MAVTQGSNKKPPELHEARAHGSKLKAVQALKPERLFPGLPLVLMGGVRRPFAAQTGSHAGQLGRKSAFRGALPQGGKSSVGFPRTARSPLVAWVTSCSAAG